MSLITPALAAMDANTNAEGSHTSPEHVCIVHLSPVSPLLP